MHCVYLMYVGTHRGRKRSLDRLKLELEVVVTAGNFWEPNWLFWKSDQCFDVPAHLSRPGLWF